MSLSIDESNIYEAKKLVLTSSDENEIESTLMEIADYAVYSNNRELCQFVINHGDTVVSKSEINCGLLAATGYDRPDILNMFLNAGADDYESAMVIAARDGNRKLVDLFLELGAVNTIEAGTIAFNNGHHELAHHINSKFF